MVQCFNLQAAIDGTATYVPPVAVYRVEGWLCHHYRKFPAHDPGQSHLDEHSVTLTLNLLQLLFHALCVTNFISMFFPVSLEQQVSHC